MTVEPTRQRLQVSKSLSEIHQSSGTSSRRWYLKKRIIIPLKGCPALILAPNKCEELITIMRVGVDGTDSGLQLLQPLRLDRLPSDDFRERELASALRRNSMNRMTEEKSLERNSYSYLTLILRISV